MATEIEALVVRMEANLRGYERSLARANTVTTSAMKRIETDTADTMRRVERLTDRIDFGGLSSGAAAAARALGPLGGAIAGALSVAGITSFADQFTRVQNSLKVAGLSGRELESVYQDLFAVAQQQGAPLEATATLYGRIASVQKELGVTSQQIIKFTEGVGVALRVQGTDATQASGALLQLGQALGSGKVQAEEFNSILEGARPILQTVANGLLEAGGSVSKLKQLVVDGELSSKAFFAAFERGRPTLDELAKNAVPTISQGIERLKNEAINAVGAVNDLTGFTAKLGGVMSAAAGGVSSLAAALRGLSQSYTAAAQERAKFIAQGGEDTVADAFEGAFGNVGAMRDRRPPPQLAAQSSRGLEGTGVRGPADNLDGSRRVLSPISVKDPRFAVPSDAKGKGGGGGSSAEKVSDYEREVEALNKRTAALNLDIETFGRSAEAISRAKVEQELLNALQKDGVTASEAQRQKISELAQAYSETEARLKALKSEQEQFKALQVFVGTSLGGFLSDIGAGGKSAERALESLKKKLIDVAFQAILLGKGPLGGLLGGSGGGGLIGALFGAFGSGGGAVGAPLRLVGAPALAVGTSNVPRDMLANIHKGEMVIPKYDADLLRGGGMAGGSFTYAPVIDARGADAGAVSRIERAMQEQARTFSAQVAAANRMRTTRGVRP
jgi:tape measure domain-containing protein